MALLVPGARLTPQALPDLQGAARSLAPAWAGVPALLVVAHGECPTSRLALPYVERIHRGKAERAAVLAVLQEEPEEARALIADLGLTLPVLLDRDPFAFGDRLGIETVPTLLLVAKGEVRRVVEGFSRDELEALAAKLGVRPPLFPPGDNAPRRRPG